MGKVSTAHHVKALIAGLDNEPQKYEYTGQVNDLGHDFGNCACGHPIRFQFVVKHCETGDIKFLGSTCINHYATYRPEDAQRMQEWLKVYEAKKREKARTAKVAAEAIECLDIQEAYFTAYDKMKSVYESYRSGGVRAPRSLWEIADSWKWGLHRVCPKHYTRVKSYMKWYQEHLKIIEQVLTECAPDVARIQKNQEKILQERLKHVQDNQWLIEVLEAADKGRSCFISDMIKALKTGKILTSFSPRQKEVLCEVFGKHFGRKNSTKNLRAVDYFNRRCAGEQVEQPVVEYVAEKPVIVAVNASEGIETNGLPF